MNKRTLELFALLLGVVATFGCVLRGNNVAQSESVTKNAQAAQGLSLEIPDAAWEPVFFEDLNDRTKRSGISNLRQTVLADDDLEVRFWFDHFEQIDGVIIRRSGQEWSAISIRDREQHQPSSLEQESLRVPKSGWEATWKKLTSAGILTLADGSMTKCKPDVLDGIGYVIETNFNRKYRTYRYGNPQRADCDEAKRILLMETILFEELDLANHYK